MTPKQRRFVDEYLTDLNAAQAAIRSGYSEKTARQIGSELLTIPDIAAEVANRQAVRSEKSGITQEWLAAELEKNFGMAQGAEDFSAANKSLELLGKLHGLFVEKSEVNFPDPRALSDEEIEKRRKSLKIA